MVISNDHWANVPVVDLVPHPKNPRLRLREEVVSAIAEALKDSLRFEPRHALAVRQKGKKFEVISGHHRLEAAKVAGLETVPAWIVEMDDEQAYMALVEANNQGELAPLEIGIHLLGVELGKPGRGIEGGLREYARRTGKQEANLRRLRDAAAVYTAVSKTRKCDNIIAFSDLLKKAYHLEAFKDQVGKRCLPEAIERALTEDWTVEQCKDVASLVPGFRQSLLSVKPSGGIGPGLASAGMAGELRGLDGSGPRRLSWC